MTPLVCYIIIGFLLVLIGICFFLISNMLYKNEKLTDLYLIEKEITTELENQVNLIQDLVVTIKQLPTDELSTVTDAGRMYTYMKNTIDLVMIERPIGS